MGWVTRIKLRWHCCGYRSPWHSGTRLFGGRVRIRCRFDYSVDSRRQYEWYCFYRDTDWRAEAVTTAIAPVLRNSSPGEAEWWCNSKSPNQCWGGDDWSSRCCCCPDVLLHSQPRELIFKWFLLRKWKSAVWLMPQMAIACYALCEVFEVSKDAINSVSTPVEATHSAPTQYSSVRGVAGSQPTRLAIRQPPDRPGMAANLLDYWLSI